MKSLYLTLFSLLFGAVGIAQLSINDLTVDATSNALRMDVSFSTSDNARSYIEYSRVVFDEENNPIDTTYQYTPLSEPSSDHYFNVWELVAATDYNCTLWAINGDECTSEDFTFTTDILPEVVPTLDSLYVNPDAELDGYYITNTVQVSDKTLQIFNRRGEIVWYTYHSGEPEVGNLQNCQMFNITDDDDILTLECHQISRWDLAGNLLNNVDLNGTAYDSLYFHHDVIVNEAGNYVVVAASAMEVDFGDSTDVVIGENLLEITPDGEVIWSWSAFDHFDATTAQISNGFFTPIFGGEAVNWLHCNAVYQDDEGFYIMCYKEQHQLVKVDNVSGDVEWVLGGSNSTIDFEPFDIFGDQHAINRTFVGTYMVFDNTGLDTLSRFLEFSLEVYEELTAVPQWEYVLPQENFSPILGNAQRVPGGNRYGCSGTSGAIIEVDQLGEVLWHMEQSAWLYRTFLIDELIDNSIEDIDMGINPDLVCIDEGAFSLDAEPAEGCWMGDGVTDGEFDPMAAGIGTHTLTYRWGWNEESIEIEVSDAVPPCAVNMVEQSAREISVFPNPNNGSFTLEINSLTEDFVHIRIVDMLGRTVWNSSQMLVSGLNNIQLETNIAAGNYSLLIEGELVRLKQQLQVK